MRAGDFDAVLSDDLAGPNMVRPTSAGTPARRQLRPLSNADGRCSARRDPARGERRPTTQAGVAAFQQCDSSTTRPPSFSHGASERARSAADSSCRPEPGRDMFATLRLWRAHEENRSHVTTDRSAWRRGSDTSRRGSRCCSAARRCVPLLAYGFVSLLSLQRGTRDSVINGNQNVATRAAEEIRRYVVDQRRAAEGARRPTSRTPASTSGSRIDPQELRPPVPRVPRAHAVRRDRAR